MNFEEFQTNRDSMSLAHWSLGKWKNLSESGKGSGKMLNTSLHNAMPYMKRSRLACSSLKASAVIKEQLMSMVRQRKQVTHGEKAAAVALTGRTVRADSILSGMTKPQSGAAQSCLLEQAIFAKQTTKKAEQEMNRHVIKTTRR